MLSAAIESADAQAPVKIAANPRYMTAFQSARPQAAEEPGAYEPAE